MISGAHVLLYSTDAEADRGFLRDVLELRSVDAGGGWLIFALPPAEIAVHPADEPLRQAHGGEELSGCVLYLMCSDLRATLDALEARGAAHAEVVTAEWGIATSLGLPSGARVGLYQPTHPTAI